MSFEISSFVSGTKLNMGFSQTDYATRLAHDIQFIVNWLSTRDAGVYTCADIKI